MREFFRGWRRKMGVMALVMACALSLGWFRSEIVSEVIIFPISRREAVIIVSSHGCFSVDKGPMGTPREPIWVTAPALWIKKAQEGKETHGWPSIGFLNKVSSAAVPYWSVVLPLALLSSCLLFSKPRVVKPPESTNPPDEDTVTHA